MLSSSIVIAQISDSHLFADKHALHCGANVYQNLQRVLADISENNTISYLVFTGDLSQDHSEQSYKRFVDLVQAAKLSIPVYFLPGNHDEPSQLARHLITPCFNQASAIEHSHWQVFLLNSKSDTPAGYVTDKTLTRLNSAIDNSKSQLIFMHHHPIDVGYFIDRHGLINQQEFWQSITQHSSVKAIACGHIHRGLALLPAQTQRPVPLYTCPATSIQFDPKADTVSALALGPGYRLLTLKPNGDINTELKYLPLL